MTTQFPRYEIPSEMREFAEKSVEQARKAVDGFIDAAQRAAETVETSAETAQSSAKDFGKKAFSYAEHNISSAFDLAQKLVRSKDINEAMQHQAEFARKQFESLQTQVREFGTMAQDVVKDAVKDVAKATPKKPV